MVMGCSLGWIPQERFPNPLQIPKNLHIVPKAG